MPSSLPPAKKGKLLRSLAAGREPEAVLLEEGVSRETLRDLLGECAAHFEGQAAGAAWTVFIDGASRRNPGPSAAGVVIREGSGTVKWQEGIYLGIGTNNEAEYRALILALERAAELGAARLRIHSDSELLVRQWNGRYRVKEPRLVRLHARARELGGRFSEIRFVHVPREQNKQADGLANQALDEYISAQNK